MRWLRQWWWRYHWLILVFLAVGGFTLGYIGFDRYYSHPPVGVPKASPSVADLVWYDIRLFSARATPTPPLPWELEIAQFMPLLVLYGAVAGFVSLFRDRVQRARLPFVRGHVVVAGMGAKGRSFIDAMRTADATVVALERDADNPNITAARAQGAIVLIGDARDARLLGQTGVHRAGHLLVTADDATNIEIALQAQVLARGRRGAPLECLAHVVDPDLCALLKLHALADGNDASFRVDFFNFDDQAARALSEMVEHEQRVFVVGHGPLSDRLVLHSIFVGRDDDSPTASVTLVDRAAKSRLEGLGARFPSVRRSKYLHAIDQSVEDLIVDPTAVLDEHEGPALVYLADADEAQNVEAGFALKDAARKTASRLVVCTERADGLAALLADSQGTSLDAVSAVALAKLTCNQDLVSEGIYELLGRAIHAEYVRTRQAEGAGPDDPALASWDDLDESLKSSNRAQAQHIGVKLRAVGCDLVPLRDAQPEPFVFTPDEIEQLARLEHDRWVAERRADGWRPGSERDPERRRTPYLVPWSPLSEEIRDRDRETIRKLPTHAAAAGFQVIRVKHPITPDR